MSRAAALVRPPVALAIGGLDPSGGAGLAADLRAFGAAGCWGCAVAAVLTVQSTRGLVAARPIAAPWLEAQLETVLADMRIGAVKTGALGSSRNVRVVTRVLAARPSLALVVDPVLRPSRGRAALCDAAALGALRDLAAAATVLTPNVAEAEALLGGTIGTRARAREAARALLELGPRAVLLKGGHLGGRVVTDHLATAGAVQALSRRRVAHRGEIHGTGCTLAALVAGRLAGERRGALASAATIEAAVRWSLRRLVAGLRSHARVGAGMAVLGALGGAA